MIAASEPRRQSRSARLLVVARGRMVEAPRSRLIDFLDPGDLLVANDAATLPASLAGVHSSSGEPVELRLAGRRSLAAHDVRDFTAVVFGSGDHRTRTEDRPAPPTLRPGDELVLGPLRARVNGLLSHPRLVSVAFGGASDHVWRGIAEHGRPVQYAHVPEVIELWDAWTRVAACPVAFEPPSAGFALDWSLLDDLRLRGIGFATLTHAAGISSTGDPVLDTRLPFDEAYHVPATTVEAIEATRESGGRVVAVGTTVTRALEHGASQPGGLRPGEGLATQCIGPHTRLRAVDAILSGVHDSGESHHELLRAFLDDATLTEADRWLRRLGFRSHEFGDSVLIRAS